MGDGLTSTPPSASFGGRCFLSFNSADALVSSVVRDVAERLKRLQVGSYNYQVDPNVHSKWDAIKEELEDSSSIGFFVGQAGFGKIQDRLEVDWALTASAKDGGPHLFVVLLPGATAADLLEAAAPNGSANSVDTPVSPGSLLSEAPWIPLDAADLDDGRLADSGFAKVCGGILREKLLPTQEAIARRERELFLTRPKRARALLVGIEHYTADETLQNLDAPKHDVAELEKLLRSLELPGGLKWEPLQPRLDLDGSALQDDLQRFFRDEARPDDLLLFYFSGHGITASGDPYLVPSNGNASTPKISRCVAADQLAEWLESSPAWAAVAVLDCCHGHNVTGPAAAMGQPSRSVVFAASAGQTPAIGPDNLSPFTSSLISILSSAGPLTMGQVADQLAQRHASSRAQLGVLGAIENLTFGTPTTATPAQPERPTGRIRLAVESARQAEVELLKQLTRTVDALLAVVAEGGDGLDALIEDSRRLIAERLRDLTVDPDGQGWDKIDGSDTSTLLEVLFDKKELHPYASLPWEYLRLPSAEEPSLVTRVVPVAATKAADGDPPRSPFVLSEPAPSWGPSFRSMTKSETGLTDDAFVRGSTEGWTRLRQSAAVDIIAIQCGLQPNGNLALGRRGFAVSSLKPYFQSTPIRYVVLETIADEDNPAAAATLRANAFQVAADTGRSVIAVCHPASYAARLSEINNVGQSQTPTYSFVAQVLKKLRAGMRLEDAAYGARQDVAGNLWPPDVSAVGMPVVVRAEPGHPATSTASMSTLSGPRPSIPEQSVSRKPGGGLRP